QPLRAEEGAPRRPGARGSARERQLRGRRQRLDRSRDCRGVAGDARRRRRRDRPAAQGYSRLSLKPSARRARTGCASRAADGLPTQGTEARVRTKRAIAVALTLGIFFAGDDACAQPDAAPAYFDIPAGELADAIDRFGEQSGLQVVYENGLLDGTRVPGIAGTLPPRDVLDRFAAEAGLAWELVNDDTVVLRRIARDTTRAARPRGEPVPASAPPPLENVVVVGDPRRILPSTPSSAAFGVAKPLLETPRS